MLWPFRRTEEFLHLYHRTYFSGLKMTDPESMAGDMGKRKMTFFSLGPEDFPSLGSHCYDVTLPPEIWVQVRIHHWDPSVRNRRWWHKMRAGNVRQWAARHAPEEIIEVGYANPLL